MYLSVWTFTCGRGCFEVFVCARARARDMQIAQCKHATVRFVCMYVRRAGSGTLRVKRGEVSRRTATFVRGFSSRSSIYYAIKRRRALSSSRQSARTNWLCTQIAVISALDIFREENSRCEHVTNVTIPRCSLFTLFARDTSVTLINRSAAEKKVQGEHESNYYVHVSEQSQCFREKFSRRVFDKAAQEIYLKIVLYDVCIFPTLQIY